MYKIIKQTLNSAGNVINSEDLGFVEDYSTEYIEDSIKSLIAVENYNHAINGSECVVRIVLEEIELFDFLQFNTEIYNKVDKCISSINKAIAYKNDTAIISAKRQNKDKVQLIKEIDYYMISSSKGTIALSYLPKGKIVIR